MIWVCIGTRAVRFKMCDGAGRVAATDIVERVESKRSERTRMVRVLKFNV